VRGTVIRTSSWYTSFADTCDSGAGDSTFEARSGDSFVVPGGMEHQASALEESEVLDVFTPFREEYAEKR
jgi:quercetin dioxygenase-like cupin family protein